MSSLHVSFLVMASFVLGALGWFAAAQAAEPTTKPSTPANEGQPTITGPFVHENLAVFLLHGPDRLKDKHYLTLQEALDRSIVVVHETGNVNELTIENVSPDQEVYIQSGDIVKGGRQDRMIAIDFIAPAKSGQMPINAFCVEHGRWHQRAGEASDHFANSAFQAAGKDLKLAAKQAGSQAEVWRQVAENQSKLAMNAGASVNAPASSTSFQLSMETKAVQENIEGYLKALEPVARGQDDVIGYAFAINGKINSADIYANHELFAKLWPKLIKSSAVEAFAETQKGKQFAACKADDVYQCMSDARSGKSSDKEVTARVQMRTRETDQNVVFETRDGAAAAAPIHETFVNKKK